MANSSIIVRTLKDSIIDTSKQRVIETCCDNKDLRSVKDASTRIRVFCRNCGTCIVDILF